MTKQLWHSVTVFDGRALLPEPMAVITRGDRIARLCRVEARQPDDLDGGVEAGTGGLPTPGLVDCHTHVVFAGNRAGECEQRPEGTHDTDIAAAGRSILSAVRATRATDGPALLDATLPRVQARSQSEPGTVQAGGIADFCIRDVEHPSELACAVQSGRLRQRIHGGQITSITPTP